MTVAPVPITSRYYGIETTQFTTTDGRVVTYIQRRFLPSPDLFAPLQEHIVTDGDRPDTIADHYLGDALQFWRICDANNAMRPDDLTATIGSTVLITLPAGVPAPTGAQ